MNTVTAIQNYLFSQGVLGIVSLVLGIVVLYLYRKNIALTEQLFALQDKRLAEAVETADRLNMTMTTFSQATSMLNAKIVDVQRRRR